MSHFRLLYPLTGFFAAILLSGCISVPQAIRGHSEQPQQDLLRVMNAPELYIGQESRFGGRVISVRNQQGTTRIELGVQPLDSGAKPIPGSAAQGRLYADISGFVDPIDLQNQYLTVLGTIKGTVQGKIGQQDYRFVVITVTGYQRWRVNQEVILPPVPDPWIWYGPNRRGPVLIDPWWGYAPGPLPVQTYLSE